MKDYLYYIYFINVLTITLKDKDYQYMTAN